jgi:hypothetical protein
MFSVAIAGLTKYKRPQEPSLNLWISADNDVKPYVDLLDPKSHLWENNVAAKVSFLKLVTCDEGNRTWEEDLLYSIPNLQHFNFEGNVPNSIWVKLSWPLLYTMELQDLFLPSDGFIVFMGYHAALSSVSLMRVGVLEGTWEEPLKKITEMKKLHHLHLLDLYKTAPSVGSSDPIKHLVPKMEPEVVLSDRDEINIAAETLHRHFWTANVLAITSRVRRTRRVYRLSLLAAIAYIIL